MLDTRTAMRSASAHDRHRREQHRVVVCADLFTSGRPTPLQEELIGELECRYIASYISSSTHTML